MQREVIEEPSQPRPIRSFGSFGSLRRIQSAASLRPGPVVLGLALVVAACGSETQQPSAATSNPTVSSQQPATEGTSTSGTPASTTARADRLYPDVVAAEAVRADDGSWTFSVTISSPYDTPDRYADAWRVVGPDGEVYGIRELVHDHQAEQPFTRSQSGIEIPRDVEAVTVEGRDQANGWGGAVVRVELNT